MTKTENALQFICPDDREVWITTGMGIKQEHGDAGFDMWNRWSIQSESYKPESAKAVWRSFKAAGKITIASLFFLAKQNGWKDDGSYAEPTPEEKAERKRLALGRLTEEEKATEEARRIAAQKATKILGLCELDRHAYCDSHGFKELLVNVWRREDEPPLVVIPMYYRGNICGVQLISVKGEKKFLRGQRTSEAYFKVGSGGQTVLAEGFMTAMAVHTVLAKINVPCTVVACFSAGNMAKLAKQNPDAWLVCDNDHSGTGLKVGIESGLKYWMSPIVGEDFCDYLMRVKLFTATMEVRAWVMKVKKELKSCN